MHKTIYILFIFSIGIAFAQNDRSENDKIEFVIKDSKGNDIESPLFGYIKIEYLLNNSYILVDGFYFSLEEEGRFYLEINDTFPSKGEFKFTCNESFYYTSSISIYSKDIPEKIIFYLRKIPDCELDKIK